MARDWSPAQFGERLCSPSGNLVTHVKEAHQRHGWAFPASAPQTGALQFPPPTRPQALRGRAPCLPALSMGEVHLEVRLYPQTQKPPLSPGIPLPLEPNLIIKRAEVQPSPGLLGRCPVVVANRVGRPKDFHPF